MSHLAINVTRSHRWAKLETVLQVESKEHAQILHLAALKANARYPVYLMQLTKIPEALPHKWATLETQLHDLAELKEPAQIQCLTEPENNRRYPVGIMTLLLKFYYVSS
jgi:hypothetical protein